ncbi:MAG: DMT family transporter [Oscillospiraceae bacterium]|nr:DMT family transporter [Oscillospiraceae bacterium]
MRKTTPKGIIFLLITAIIWGSSFVAQEIGMKSIDAFTFTGIRTTLGAIFLLPIVLILNKGLDLRKNTLVSGLVLGVVFSVAQNFQQFAFYYSTSGKIAFITAFYMFFVPLFSVFLGKKIKLLTWLSILMGLVGLFFLCINPSDLTSINLGDLLALACAVFYVVQIMLIDRFLEKDINGVQLSFMQFAVAAVISIAAMFIFEHPVMADIKTAAPSLLYSGIMSCGIAYTFQIVGQKHANPVVASLLMCMESVFAVIAAAVVLHQGMSLREGIGCAIMFAAIILSQLSESLSRRPAEGPLTQA